MIHTSKHLPLVTVVGERGLCNRRSWRVFCGFGGEWAETRRENLELTGLRTFLAESTACADVCGVTH